jgi:hypothetical protein
MNNKVIHIEVDDWEVIYFKGKKFAEGHEIKEEKLIRLGMLMQEAKMDISDFVSIYIEEDDVSDEELLWTWDADIGKLPDEIKNIITENI